MAMFLKGSICLFVVCRTRKTWGQAMTSDCVQYSAVHSAQCTLWCVLCTVRCAQCTVHNALCTVHSAQCTVHSTLCTVHCAQYTVHIAQCTMHCPALLSALSTGQSEVLVLQEAADKLHWTWDTSGTGAKLHWGQTTLGPNYTEFGPNYTRIGPNYTHARLHWGQTTLGTLAHGTL